MKNYRLVLTLVFIVGITTNCEDSFEYSPYAANVKDSYKNVGAENIQTINNNNNDSQNEFSFAVFADSHYNYHELDGAISNLNNKEEIDFVVVNGDMADHGYLKEFELFHETMKDLDIPYVTTIGNHDYRSNGEKIYTEMYGAKNYSFEYHNCLFIMWDDVFWESNKYPDFDWLEQQLQMKETYNHVFVICHIPPFGSQFEQESEQKYSTLMSEYNVDLSIHGHMHCYQYSEYYKDGVDYLVVESIMDSEYAIMSVTKGSIEIERVKY
jgi:predicted phosphodiesterase